MLRPPVESAQDTSVAFTSRLADEPDRLGTDDLGVDVLGELMKGGQAALEIGFLAAFMGLVIGALWGAISGLAGGVVDSLMVGVVDVFLFIPGLFIVLIVAVRYGASVLSLIIVNVTFNIADAILVVATLGFLGFGLHYPAVDWGDMLSKGVT